MIVQTVGDRIEIAAGEQALEPLEECRVDRQRVDESAVHGAGLFDQDFSVALDDVRLDFGDVLVDEGFDGLLTGKDPGSSFADAGWAERIGLSGPAELRVECAVAVS